jgi:hypothetical protein
VPVATVTLYVVPLPVTELTSAEETPVVVREKSVLSTPVTLVENVTVNTTLEVFVGLAVARTIDETAGAAQETTVEAAFLGVDGFTTTKSVALLSVS